MKKFATKLSLESTQFGCGYSHNILVDHFVSPCSLVEGELDIPFSLSTASHTLQRSQPLPDAGCRGD
jgi:hypothetical protein